MTGIKNLFLGGGLLALLTAAGAQAAVLGTNSVVAVDFFSSGSIRITSTVFDNFAGDFSKHEFRYDVENIDYDPNPGTSNGLSGFNIVFATAVPGIADQYAPAGWETNCCGTTPPFGAEADIRNSDGFGIPIGGTGSFGYTVPAGSPGLFWTDNYMGSWGHSWEDDLQTTTFDLIDAASGVGVIIPGVPEPSTVVLAISGLLCVGAMVRRRS